MGGEGSEGAVRVKVAPPKHECGPECKEHGVSALKDLKSSLIKDGATGGPGVFVAPPGHICDESCNHGPTAETLSALKVSLGGGAIGGAASVSSTASSGVSSASASNATSGTASSSAVSAGSTANATSSATVGNASVGDVSVYVAPVISFSSQQVYVSQAPTMYLIEQTWTNEVVQSNTATINPDTKIIKSDAVAIPTINESRQEQHISPAYSGETPVAATVSDSSNILLVPSMLEGKNSENPTISVQNITVTGIMAKLTLYQAVVRSNNTHTSSTKADPAKQAKTKVKALAIEQIAKFKAAASNMAKKKDDTHASPKNAHPKPAAKDVKVTKVTVVQKLQDSITKVKGSQQQRKQPKTVQQQSVQESAGKKKEPVQKKHSTSAIQQPKPSEKQKESSPAIQKIYLGTRKLGLLARIFSFGILGRSNAISEIDDIKASATNDLLTSGKDPKPEDDKITALCRA